MFTSAILGLLVNYFNSNGISLSREKKELPWASDSLLFNSVKDSTLRKTDSVSIKSEESKPDFKVEKDKDKKESKKINEEISRSDNMNLKERSSESEVKSFTEPKAIKLEQAYVLFNRGVKFIDARDESDYLAGHIKNSINIPFEDFDNHKQKLNELSKEEPVVIYCAGTDCDLSILLGNKMYEMSYKQVYVFFGGWVEWIDSNYPIETSSE